MRCFAASSLVCGKGCVWFSNWDILLMGAGCGAMPMVTFMLAGCRASNRRVSNCRVSNWFTCRVSNCVFNCRVSNCITAFSWRVTRAPTWGPAQEAQARTPVDRRVPLT